MAKATLPTNYKDDIMATPMGGLRRYRPIQNDDGTVSFEDVTDYTQVGSNFGAAQMNQTNTAVNNSADKSRIIDSLADVAANTQAGMMAGALAVRELNGKSDWNLVVSNKSATEITNFEMPTDRNEILVGVVFGDGGRNFVLSKVFHRGYDFTDSNPALHMLGGFQGTNYNSGCYVSVKSGAVHIDSVFYNNNDIKKNSKYFVAYR